MESYTRNAILFSCSYKGFAHITYTVTQSKDGNSMHIFLCFDIDDNATKIPLLQ